MSPEIQHEIRNALWGCLEIPLYLKMGATRFSGTIAAFKRSCVIPILIIPAIMFSVPSPEIYADRSLIWQFMLMLIQVVLGTAIFASIIYVFKAKHVTTEEVLKCLTGYNWMSLSAFMVNVPLILLAVTGVNTWSDVSAMMILITLYSYSFLTFMIMHILRLNIFLAVSFVLADVLMSEIIRNFTTYLMLQI